MKSDKHFPVTKGEVLTLSCTGGQSLGGDKKVTCTKNTDFDYKTEPQCGKIRIDACYCNSFSVVVFLMTNRI
jgi:hypothetical protein